MLRVVVAVLIPSLSLFTSLVHAQGTVTVTGASSKVTCTRFHRTGFWDIDIDNYPARPAECGPPLSFNAIRDKSKLPVQIAGIVGAYVFFLLSVSSLLLTLGRRMRKNAEQSTGTLKEIEMMNTSKYGISSPAPSQKSWIKGFRSFKGLSSVSNKGGGGSHPVSPVSPGLESLSSFDNRVLQNDRESRQAEMDRLYAAVLVHEEQKKSSRLMSTAASHESLRSGADLSTVPESFPMSHESLRPASNFSAAQDRISASPPKSIGDPNRKNLRVQIAEAPSKIPRGSVSEDGPRSPYKAIYPPYPSPGVDRLAAASAYTPVTPRTPFSPARIDLPNDMYPASPPPKNVRMQMPPPRSSGNDSSTSSKSRKLGGIKNLRISGPQPYSGDDDAEDRMPLSPMPVDPPAPPAAPPAYHERSLSDESNYSPIAEQHLDLPKPLPFSQPSHSSFALPSSPKPSFRAQTNSGTTTNALPLRAYATSQETLSTSTTNPLSPGPIKQTILERKVDPRGRGPLTGRTPRTGVPMTPYTPYMPFTPVTPVTPGLVSKKERKERIKAEGRKVLVEEDEVKNEEDLWNGGY